jgi:hypothetical protein
MLLDEAKKPVSAKGCKLSVYVRVEVIKAVTMKRNIFWSVTPYKLV